MRVLYIFLYCIFSHITYLDFLSSLFQKEEKEDDNDDDVDDDTTCDGGYSARTEAIASLQKALSCNVCRRLPSSSLSSTTTSHDGTPYHGGLLVSPCCGHSFCNDCWNGSEPQCPTCLCETTPVPMFPTLVAASAAVP